MIVGALDRWVARAARLSGEASMSFDDRQAIVAEALEAATQVITDRLSQRRTDRALRVASVTSQLECERRDRSRAEYRAQQGQAARAHDAL